MGASAGSLALPRQTQIAAPLQPNAHFFKILLKWLRGVDFFMDSHIFATPLSHFQNQGFVGLSGGSHFPIRFLMKIIDLGAQQPQARFQGFGGLSGGDHFLIRVLMKIIDLGA